MKRLSTLVFGMLLLASCAPVDESAKKPREASITMGLPSAETPEAPKDEWITYQTKTPLVLETYNIDFPYKAPGIESLIEGCGRTVDKAHVETVANTFAKTLGIAYVFTPSEAKDGKSGFVATAYPNDMHYASIDDFNADFELCSAGGDFYPADVTPERILFVNSCGSGAGEPTDCDAAKEALGDSVKLAR